MKKLNAIFGLLMALAVAISFSSCGSDDDDGKTEYELKNAITTATHNLGIANAGSEVTSTPTTTILDDMLKGYSEYKPPVISGVMSLTQGTSITITGLKDGVVLENFKLEINGVTKEFGSITSSNTQLYIDANQQFFKDVFNRMVSMKKLDIKATYKPTVKITDADALTLNVTYQATYKYRK